MTAISSSTDNFEKKTLEHIRSLAGTHFDPQAVELLSHTMDEDAEGH